MRDNNSSFGKINKRLYEKFNSITFNWTWFPVQPNSPWALATSRVILRAASTMIWDSSFHVGCRGLGWWIGKLGLDFGLDRTSLLPNVLTCVLSASLFWTHRERALGVKIGETKVPGSPSQPQKGLLPESAAAQLSLSSGLAPSLLSTWGRLSLHGLDSGSSGAEEIPSCTLTAFPQTWEQGEAQRSFNN